MGEAEGSTPELNILLEEYKLLCASLDRHQNFIYGVLPGLGALAAAGTAFLATKEMTEGKRIILWVAAAWVVSLAILWTTISHSILSFIALHLVSLELQINRALGLRAGDYPRFAAIDTFRHRTGLAYHTASLGSGLGAAPNLRLLISVANLVLIGFVVVCLVLVIRTGPRPLWVANALALAVCLLSTVCAAATTRRVSRHRDDLVHGAGQLSPNDLPRAGTNVGIVLPEA